MRKYAFRESKTTKESLIRLIREATKGTYLTWNRIKREVYSLRMRGGKRRGKSKMSFWVLATLTSLGQS